VIAVSLQLTTTTTVNSHTDNRKHFFDNPHRYDSEAEEIMYGSLHRSRYVLVQPVFTLALQCVILMLNVHASFSSDITVNCAECVELSASSSTPAIHV